ncbi:MAG: protein kinase domain-containing protein [Chloroflexaceae bacterium]
MNTRPITRADQRAAEGAELRNYRLIKRLAQEELATVFSASHLTLERPVEVHILRRNDWVSSGRFQLAARLAARLNHPNLVPVIDAGHDERYGHYLVTPQLDAQPLSTLLATGPLPPLLAVRIVTQIAAALDYLHAQQIVHRDVQPANILVTAEGVAYLTNLSLAAAPDAPDLSSLEEADYLTPYSAPEQRFTEGEASPALDVYGLGAVTYHMLSGEVPPEPGAPLPSLAAVDPALAPADRVVRRMLLPQPQARFPGAAAAATALRQALRGQIDQATDDMEESRWEPNAEWLPNPFETALDPALYERFQEYLARARKRADELHRRDAIRRFLNRWSRDGFFRRRALGQLVQLEQIVSYNVYFYELRALYETRTEPTPRVRPQAPTEHPRTVQLSADVWQVPVPETGPLESVRPRELSLPGSERIFTCTECLGAGKVFCATCKGQGTVEKVSRVSNRDRSRSPEILLVECPTCRGYGRQDCPKCEGAGNLVEELVFTWSRRAMLFENSDDVDDLPRLAIHKCLEPVFEGPIDPYKGPWYSVAPLAELLREVIKAAGDATRIVHAELTVRGAPITEVDYLLDDQPHQLHLVGFEPQLFGDWSLYNHERIALVVVVAIVAMLTILAFVGVPGLS